MSIHFDQFWKAKGDESLLRQPSVLEEKFFSVVWHVLEVVLRLLDELMIDLADKLLQLFGYYLLPKNLETDQTLDSENHIKLTFEISI